jgi:alpha-tubulin suppressor-like RCC1 family protein
LGVENANGELTTGLLNPATATPKLANNYVVVQNDLGDKHTIALKSDGTVWTWGENGLGQLGDSTSISRTITVKLTG